MKKKVIIIGAVIAILFVIKMTMAVDFDLALNKGIWANLGANPENLVDGSDATSWQSGVAGTSSWIVDLNATGYDVNAMYVKWHSNAVNRPTTLSLFGSNDNISYTLVFTDAAPSYNANNWYEKVADLGSYRYYMHNGTQAGDEILAYTWILNGSTQVVSEGITVTLIAPSNESTQQAKYTQFLFNYTYNESANDCFLYTNETGAWIEEEHNAWTYTTDPEIPRYLNKANETTQIDHNFTVDGDYLWNIGCNLTNGSSYFSTTNYTITISSLYSYINYSSVVSELQEQTMQLTINSTNGISTSSAAFSYNNIAKNVSKVSTSTYDRYSVTFVTPSGSGTRGFSWDFNVTDNLGQNFTEQTNGTQTVNSIDIDTCSTFNVTAVNFSFVEDIGNITMNGSIDAYFRLWVSSASSYKEFNLSWVNKQNPAICILNNSENYNVYAQLEYYTDNTDYSKKTYYFYNSTLDNETDFVILYLTPNSTQVTFEVTDENDDGISDAYLHILKYDLGTNSYTTNSILKTNTDGKDFAEMLLFTTWYKFFVYKDGILLLETEPTKITTTSEKLRVRLTDIYSSSYGQLSQMTTSLVFNNVTKNFVYTFSNPTGLPKTFCLKVTKRKVTQDQLVDNVCSSSTSGTLLVNIGADPEDATYLAYGTVEGSPQISDLFYELKISEEAWKTYGQDGIYMTFYLKVAFAMIGIWNPYVAIALIVFADVAMFMLGIYQVSWSVLLIYIILAGIVAWKVSRR